MKRYLGVTGLVLGCLLGLSVTNYAGQVGIEGTLGLSSLGVSFYENTYAAGVYYGQGQDETPGVKVSVATFGGWAELRTKIEKDLFFAYGVGTYLKTGVGAGTTLETFGIEPFVSFEYYATPHLMLSLWNNLIDYSSTKMTSGTFTKSSLFQSYAAVTYLF